MGLLGQVKQVLEGDGEGTLEMVAKLAFGEREQVRENQCVEIAVLFGGEGVLNWDGADGHSGRDKRVDNRITMLNIG